MSIKRRIWALPVISTIIFGLGVAVSTGFANGALDSIHTTESADYPVLALAKAVEADIEGVTGGLRDAVSEGDTARMAQVGEQAGKVRKHLDALARIDGMAATGAGLAREFDAYYTPAVLAARIMLDLEEGDAQATVARMQEAQGTLNTNVATLGERAQQRFTDGISRSADSVRRALWATVVTALVVIAALALVSWFVVRTIWLQLGGEPEYAREITRAVAAGDLSMEIRTEADDTHSLLAALREMRERLATMMADIKGSAETIAGASAEIATGNADLASRTESQAGRLEHTAREMEALTDTVRANAASTGQASQLAVSATDIATRGGVVVGNVVSTMGAINTSARQIVEIIAVIDGIAFQTNILALNAAVEAARAGEQGRGFAVVAGEVRTLAQRSAAAAKEVKQLIGDSVANIHAGSTLVDQAGATMEQIVASVREVHDIMAEITEAGRRQREGIEQIGRAIDDMDQMTQQNSALVEEASAAAASLTEQTGQLSGALAVFKLGTASAPALADGARTRPAPALGLG